MKYLMSVLVRRAERRAAPWATKGPLVAPGDRPTYSSDEGQS
jgi:hypothetical protein